MVRTANIGTLIAKWAEMPGKVGQLATSVESLAAGLKETNNLNASEHRGFRDSLKDQAHALSNIGDDLEYLKEELRRRLDN